MVPRAQPTSYYGRPVIRAPVWRERDIAGYFFLGGLAGASSVLGAAAQLTRRPVMARTCKLAAATAAALSGTALVRDLGRPERFYNMLRVFKPTSPLNMGSWILAGYAPAATVSALQALSGRAPAVGAGATTAAALIGPLLVTYTGVLIADTAVPAWHDAYRELPFVFAGSSITAAAGLALAGSPPAESAPARRLAVAGACLELAGTTSLERRLGMVAEPYRSGRPGRLLRAARTLAATGAAAGLVLGRRSRLAASASGLALLTASALMRAGIFEAGLQSARDPRYTVGPQRERLQGRARPPA